MASIRLLVVDDHPVFRQGLRDVFMTDDDFQVVGEAGNGQTALQSALELQPDVVLMDINLPGGSGLQATERILEALPATRVVMITGYDEPEQMYHSLRVGARAFCSKDAPPETLKQTVRHVHEGQFVLQNKVLNAEEAEQWVDKRQARFGQRPQTGQGVDSPPLTPREMEILELICGGASNKEIARRLGISYQTVKNHVTAILHKLDVKDRTQAVLFAIRHDWFDVEQQP